MLQGRQSAGHPVDIATGTVWSLHNDLTVPGRIRLTWPRRYSISLLSSPASPHGQGWTTRYFATLTRVADGYQLWSPEGDSVHFPDPDNAVSRGETIRLLDSFQELTRRGNRLVVTRWNVDSNEIEEFVFLEGKPGRPYPLVAIENGTGQGLDLSYDNTGRLERIQQRIEGRALQLEYASNGLIKSIVLRIPDAETVVLARYEYDANNRLIRAINALGHAYRYEYDHKGRLTAEFLRGGGSFRFEYEDDSRCRRTYGDKGYNERNFHYLDHVGWTEVYDSLGQVWRFERNEQNQIVTAISPRGAVKKTEYDEHGRITSVTDAVGKVTSFEFDDFGNRTSVTVPGGATYTSEYNERHRVLRVVDPLGAEWRLEYDGNNRVTRITHPTEATWEHTWNKQGNLATVENPAGRRWYYRYDHRGQLREITDYNGASQRFKYDNVGYRSAFTTVYGDETQYQRDALGRIIRVTYPDGSTVQNVYDADGNLIRNTRPGGEVKTYTYGPCCGRIHTENNNGVDVRYEWTSEPHRLRAIVDALGQRHEYDYDEDGYLRRETFASGRTIAYERDLSGAVIRRTNGNGEAIEYTRDDAGRVVEASFPDGTKSTFAYDPASRLIKAENDDAAVEFERDGFGRKIKESCNDDFVESTYDRASFRRRRTTSQGHEASYDYDPVGRILRIALGEDAYLEFERDSGGRNTRQRFSDSVVVDRSYSPFGRLTEQRVSSGNGSGPTTEILAKRFEYDQDGRLVRTNDSRTGSTDCTYDQLGRLTERTLPDGASERFAYDAAGNITTVSVTGIFSPGDLSGSAASDRTTSTHRQIGPGNRVLRSGDTTFEYDNDDRLCRKTQDSSTDHPKVWEYRWNALGLLVEVQTPSGEAWRYGYDALGRRISKQGPNTSKRYIWDGRTIVHEIDGTDGTPKTWVFDPWVVKPLVQQENGKTHLVLSDHLGTPQELIDRDGRIGWSGQYRAWGGVIGNGNSDVDCAIRFPGQWHDEETGLHYNNFRYYDPELGSFISSDPIPQLGGPNGFRYALNPINWIDLFGMVPEYYPADSNGRPTGAYAEIGPGDTRSTNSSPADSSIHPPGWVSGDCPDHQQRSHLIADTLGGSGSEPLNLVTLTDGSNHPGMSSHERTIRNHVEAGNTVLYEVRVNYDGDNPLPTSVHMYAIDQDGNVIVDEVVENGRRQDRSKSCGC